MQERWQECADLLSTKLSEEAFRTWIKPLVFLGFDPAGRVVRLGAPTQIKVDVVRKQYLRLISSSLQQQFDPDVSVQFEVLGHPPRGDAAGNGLADPDHRLEDSAQPALRTRAEGHGPVPGAGQGPAGVGNTDNAPCRATVFSALGSRPPDERTKLSPDLTFTSFVTGKANDLARAAALQVSDRPGGAYNPLFIHGGVGLGKTHLMHAVGNAILEREPTATIRYVTANQFFQDMVSAVRREAVDSFKRYYQSLDLLLIDDIQFLSEKKRSQEEFFYVFESLVADHRQILITSDTYPKELANIDDRLVSRFNSGLIVAIEPPELEMRVAILLRKAEQGCIKLPEEVAYFVAKHIRQNVRELEGALQRIVHFAGFRNQPIELELVKEALKDILSFNRGQISIELIQRTVADYYKLKLADMYSKRKPAKIALPRQVAMYLAKELTQKSLPEIGEAFGGKDHTTVLYAVRKIGELRSHKPELNHQIHVLDQTLREFL
ncbi:MAG: chromosomal replication initiator protein DnaA [Lautropia sp.]|nr:chromosomal replication initiator protein DnaA [Lautropia sp.]